MTGTLTHNVRVHPVAVRQGQTYNSCILAQHMSLRCGRQGLNLQGFESTGVQVPRVYRFRHARRLAGDGFGRRHRPAPRTGLEAVPRFLPRNRGSEFALAHLGPFGGLSPDRAAVTIPGFGVSAWVTSYVVRVCESSGMPVRGSLAPDRFRFRERVEPTVALDEPVTVDQIASRIRHRASWVLGRRDGNLDDAVDQLLRLEPRRRRNGRQNRSYSIQHGVNTGERFTHLLPNGGPAGAGSGAERRL